VTETPENPMPDVPDDDLFAFAAEKDATASEVTDVPYPTWIDISQQPSWKVLVVDDEEGVHSVTRLALRHFTVEAKPLNFLHAYTAHEAKTLLEENPDIAVVLVDVVMESDQAGLDLVHFIRQHMHNDFIRIILRTGQPGQAPEMEVLERFKIDDYRLKTELTQDKLCAVLLASIRTYEAILKVENYRQSLEQKVVDRTAEIQANNKLLQKQKEELEQLNQLKSKLFSVLAHDMRSPLGTLQSLLSIADKDLLPPDDFQRMLKNIQTRLGHTTEMLEKLLTWANSQLKGAKVKPSIMHVSSWLKSISRLYILTALQKEIDLTVSVAEDLTFYADEDMITLALGNLVNNAIKFTPEGGKINIVAYTAPQGVGIKVVDNGIGISEQRQEKINGYGIDSTPGTDGERGTGLGLIICRDFVNQNGGYFGIKSQPGKGSTFYFVLPSEEGAKLSPVP
jgi:two-component system, sensor histidine kinase